MWTLIIWYQQSFPLLTNLTWPTWPVTFDQPAHQAHLHNGQNLLADNYYDYYFNCDIHRKKLFYFHTGHKPICYRFTSLTICQNDLFERVTKSQQVQVCYSYLTNLVEKIIYVNRGRIPLQSSYIFLTSFFIFPFRQPFQISFSAQVPSTEKLNYSASSQCPNFALFSSVP